MSWEDSWPERQTEISLINDTLLAPSPMKWRVRDGAKVASSRIAKSHICEGWRRLVMGSVRADQAARARVRAIGETLH
jgi:hypothetical protein